LVEVGSDALAGEFLLRYDLVEGAAELFGRALETREDDGEVHARLAGALYVLDDLEGAVEHYETAKRLIGSNVLVDSNLGIVHTLQGRHDAAIKAHGRALETLPDQGITPLRVILIWNAAHSLLASGRLPEGWDAYEARIPLGLGPALGAGLPEWGGHGADARNVLVLPEQGLGDELLFATCLPDLLAEAAGVYLECDPRLVDLLTRSFPAARIGPRGTWSKARATGSCGRRPTACIAAGSLPRRYRRRLDEFPADGAYLRPDRQRVDRWRRRLRRLPAGIRVGVSWRSVLAAGERRREYATLLAWAPILAQPGVQPVNLQYGDCEEELQNVERTLGIRIHRWRDLDMLDDLEEVAALVAALDIVVAPRNAVAHLAGAIGTRTLMLANPFTWSDLGTGALPWFPAVTSLYRPPGGSWHEAIELAAELLGRVVRER
jgi:hypothetical protein